MAFKEMQFFPEVEGQNCPCPRDKIVPVRGTKLSLFCFKEMQFFPEVEGQNCPSSLNIILNIRLNKSIRDVIKFLEIKKLVEFLYPDFREKNAKNEF